MRIENLDSKVIIHPNDGDHSATVILMHGLGDSGDGWLDSAQLIAERMPYTKFILPNAPRQPVTLNGGMRMNAWYDIKSLSAEDGADCIDGVANSITIVRDLINAEIALGIRNDRIALAGFSQGGAMSLYCGLQLPSELKPAGLLVMSGYLPGSNHFKLTPGFEEVPILHCHGSADPVVQYRWGQMTQSHLVSKVHKTKKID